MKMRSIPGLFAVWLQSLLLICCAPALFAQSASTGAIAGVVTDPSGALVAGANITIINDGTHESRTLMAGSDGGYNFQQLTPGVYHLEISTAGFDKLITSPVRVNVTETTRLPLELRVGGSTETVTVTSQMAQVDESSLGRVANERTVEGLPLVTRNYTQILALSPGIISSVNNATALGRGTGGTALSGTYVGGSRAYDSNFQMNGVDANDYHSSGTGASAGTPIPNPDAIAEFKVQTGQFDATYGRNAGANVNVVTKSGTDEYHGSLFEYFRNNDLNANDFFFKQVGNRRPDLKQNQFGGAVGGPIKKDKLFFFLSYQKTKQIQTYSGAGARVSCSTTATVPTALANDRSRAGLGAAFAGQKGYYGTGVPIASNGSNISTPAYNLLNTKLASGAYLIPTAQAANGSVVTAQKCTYDEDQVPASIDYQMSAKSKLSTQGFFAQSEQTVPFPIANVTGFPLTSANHFLLVSATHTYIFGPKLINEAKFGYTHVLFDGTAATTAYTYSGIGVNAPADAYSPYISISGTANLILGRTEPSRTNQHIYDATDVLTYSTSRSLYKAGGGWTSAGSDLTGDEPQDTLSFLSFNDFLLGQSSATNGTTNGTGNVYSATESFGYRDRFRHMNDWFLFGQSDTHLTPKLTLNAGLRLERFGHIVLPANSPTAQVMTNFVLPQLNTDPGTGSLNGLVVASNFNGTPPLGVIKSGTESTLSNVGTYNFGPRLGFAYQLVPNVVIRGGAGLYYTHFVTNALSGAGNEPYVISSSATSTAEAAATFSDPFPKPFYTLAQLPTFVPYSTTSTLSLTGTKTNYRPAMTESFGLNVQTQLRPDTLLEIGYLGKRATGLSASRSINPGMLASPANPIRGITTNDPSTARSRAFTTGFAPTNLSQVESVGNSWYHALQVSLTQRYKHGLQFLASYTYSKSMDDAFANESLGTAVAGSVVGDPLDRHQRWGPSGFNRPSRFVFNATYSLPSLAKSAWLGEAVNGWQLSGVATFQSGESLTVLATNSNSATGITSDKAQLSGSCVNGSGFLTTGSVRQRLNNYFNKNCFAYTNAAQTTAAFALAPNTTTGTLYGNSRVGTSIGPGQENFDAALMKNFGLHITEGSQLEFRAEAFNLVNHAQFSNPGNTITTNSTFGTITTTSVNPRIMQLALKLKF